MKRRCGECNLCCKLVPVKSIGKGAGVRCKDQRHTGCRVYLEPDFPAECRMWSCRWLVDDAGETSRPDRSHIVIDMMPDFVTIGSDRPQQVEVVQCWIDPKYPDAHKSKTFRDFVAKQAEQGKLCLLRYSSKEAAVLFGPAFMPDGSFYLRTSDEMTAVKQHSFTEIVQALAGGQLQ